MNERPLLSALVVAHNEEAQLAECLERLRFADEIVVVLDRCTDRSEEIATRFGARIVKGAWPVEGDRRNAGLDACAGPWIFEVDADERVPAALAEEIRAVIAASPHDRHLVPFDNYVGGHLVRHGWGASFGVSAAPRLTRKGTKVWGGARVHPPLELKGREGPRLTTPIEHQVDANISDMLRRLDRYTTLRADDLRERGDPDSTGRYVIRMFSRFYKCYVRRQGWREGGWGLLIALMAALYPMLAHLKAKLEPAGKRG
jgi:glycosyltransferase involved in cell wall biosynthesis